MNFPWVDDREKDKQSVEGLRRAQDGIIDGTGPKDSVKS